MNGAFLTVESRCRRLIHQGIADLIRVLFFLVTLAVGGWCAAAAQPQLISLRDPSIPLPAGGNGDSVEPRLSADGRYVLFSSSARNLVPGDNGQLGMDVFLRDRLLNTTILVSANFHGTGGGNGSSMLGMLSTYGRYVVFESDSSDLVPGDTNGTRDIFIRDLVGGTTRLVSVAAGGGFGNSASFDPVMTPDGTSVAFVSTATNLDAGDTNTMPGVFVRDLISQTTWRASAGATLPAGAASSGVMASPVITADGRYVAFFSAARGLVGGVPSLSKGEVYVHDLWTGQTIWASTNAAALAQSLLGPVFSNSPSYHPAISQDGRFVTFKTGGTNGVDPVLVLQFDSLTGATVVINTNGVSTTSWSDDVYGPEATPDGRFVAFAQRELGLSNSVFCSLHVWD